MNQEAFGNGIGTMSSSVQFGTNSEADSLNFNYENTPKPATREKHVVSRYCGQPRISGFPLSSIDSFRQSGGLSRETGRMSNGRTRRPMTGPPCKSTQRPYLESSRTHRSPCFNEAVRCDVLLKANRLFEQHTIGPLAQVPVKYRRPSTVGSRRSTSQSKMQTMGQIEPVRGEVVLTSLRSQPTPPTNSVRTRGKGELVYNGPSYLLREQAKALKDAEKEEFTSKMNESQFGLNSYFDHVEPQSESGSVTSLSFHSGYGNPRIVTVPELVDIYHVDLPPDSGQMREFSIKSRQRARTAANAIEVSSSGSLDDSVAKMKSKYMNRPRFPIK